MFKDNPDAKPISIIITTLAAASYGGEQDLASALGGILFSMGNFVRQSKPRVPNPVNVDEDFADKWYDPANAELELEKNFWLWLEQAQNDFQIIAGSRDPDFITEQVRVKFASSINPNDLRTKLGLGTVNVSTSPKSHSITETPAKPWCC